MTELESISIYPTSDRPRHAQQEIVDLLAAALLRLRARHGIAPAVDSESFGLGFSGHQRVNANPDHTLGVRK